MPTIKPEMEAISKMVVFCSPNAYLASKNATPPFNEMIAIVPSPITNYAIILAKMNLIKCLKLSMNPFQADLQKGSPEIANMAKASYSNISRTPSAQFKMQELTTFIAEFSPFPSTASLRSLISVVSTVAKTIEPKCLLQDNLIPRCTYADPN